MASIKKKLLKEITSVKPVIKWSFKTIMYVVELICDCLKLAGGLEIEL